MEIKQINNKTNEMIKKLVDCLGFDGEYYVSVNNSPIVFAKTEVPGKFLTAQSNQLKKFLDKINVDEKTKKYILSEGLIVINKKFKNEPVSSELLVTLIHEKIHSNRMLLLNSQFSENKEISSVFYDDGRFVQNSNSSKPYYADASQDILKGSIDNSKNTINSYLAKSDEEKEDIYYDDPKYDDKMEQQYKIDESLVEIMAIVAYQLYAKKTNDIMGIIKDINEKYDGEDVKAITSIILRHNDLELFKWMIDPLSYQIADVNYDYFSHYITNEDMADFNILVESEEIMFDDNAFDNYIISSRSR